MDNDSSTRSPRGMWRDYLFLTKEMTKFIQRQEMDMFFELMEQREKLQQIIIDEKTGDNYSLSAEGQQIFNQIDLENRFIRAKLQLLLNDMNKKHTVSAAYENLGRVNTGRTMDRSL